MNLCKKCTSSYDRREVIAKHGESVADAGCCSPECAAVRAYIVANGRKGGTSGTGARKRRGDSEYYRKIALKRSRKTKDEKKGG